MSSSASEQIATSQQVNLTGYACIAFSTVIFYDHIITFTEEVQLIWSRRLTGASWVFLANRLLLLVYGVALLVQDVNWDTTLLDCAMPLFLFYASNIVLCTVVAVFSTLRAYAISGRNILITSSVLSFGLAPVCMNIYMVASSHVYTASFGDGPLCLQRVQYSIHTAQLLYCLAGASAILSDSIVIGTTWHSTYLIRKQAREARVQAPLVMLILRDGTLYFLSMLMLNIAETGVATLWFSDTAADVSYTSYFAIPLGPILISRFIVNLRRTDLSAQCTSREDYTDGMQGNHSAVLQSRNRTIEFTSGMEGDMGGSLTFAPVLDSDACWDDIEEVAREDDANARVVMSVLAGSLSV